jgi:hypothetical protein
MIKFNFIKGEYDTTRSNTLDEMLKESNSDLKKINIAQTTKIFDWISGIDDIVYRNIHRPASHLVTLVPPPQYYDSCTKAKKMK